MSEKGTGTRFDSSQWGTVPPSWSPEADDTLLCCQVRQETHDVKSFVFRTRQPRHFRYRPGQFITLELNIGGEAVNRCYTLSSPPTRPDTLSITVKRKVGGLVSNWLHDNMTPGSEFKVLGPAGEFSCAHHAALKYLFLSGGSGVTPLMSMSRSLYDLGEDKDIVFVHSARSPRDIIFKHELAAMAHALPQFRTAFVCETAADDPGYTEHTGYLTLPMLRQIARDFAQREIFCCGPAPYMAAVRGILQGIGFDMSHYHEESFSFETRVAPPARSETAVAGDAQPGTKFKIEFTRSGHVIECGSDQFILDAAKAAGMRLPFSCAKGMCGTCKSKKVSGEVVMTHQGGIRQREIDQGLFLPCCSKPLSDVTIEK